MITVMILLAVAALLVTIAHAINTKVPLYVAVLLLSLFALLQVIPLGG